MTEHRSGPPDASRGYDAVLLAGFGGPEGPDDVMPFLRNVTRGRGVPEERLVEVSHHYLALGGVSPINEQNRRLRSALQAELTGRGYRLPVLWGNRNWAPYLADEVAAAQAAGVTRLLAVATSAYSSYSSCRQYREDFGTALLDTEAVGTVTVDKVRPYFDQPGFLAPFVDGTVAAVQHAIRDGLSPAELELVFTTHSVPQAVADTSGSTAYGDGGPGGAYVAQHQAVATFVASAVAGTCGRVGHRLVYQSRSGPPSVPWLEPDINDVITELAAAGRRGVIVVPIGFVSDHVEVVWDLDHEAADTAAAAHLWFARVPTPGTDARFVAALADLVVERLGGPAAASGQLAARTRPDYCPSNCCRNLRRRVPSTAGQDSATDWSDTAVDPDSLRRSGVLSSATSGAA